MPQSAYVRVERGAEVISAPFHASADRRSLLDRAHRGDIEGALGNLHSFDTGPRRTLRRRLATLLAITGTGSFRRWERAMYVLVAVNLVVIPLAVLSHPQTGTVVRAVVPHFHGVLNDAGALFVVALVGATVNPAQLFFQQSSVVD